MIPIAHRPLRKRTIVRLGYGMLVTSAVSPFLIVPVAGRAAGAAMAMRPAVKALLPPDLEGILKDELPAAVRKQPALVMATDATVGEPIAWVDEHSEIRGMAVDMADAIGYLFGKPVKSVNVVWDNLIPGLQSGRFDFSISVMLDTKKREQIVNFVDYLVDGSSFLVSADSKLHGLDLASLCGLRVAVLRGSVEQGYVTKQTEQCKKEGKPPIGIQVYQGNNDMLLAVVSGRADVMMGASSQLGYVQKLSHGRARSGGEPIGVATDGIAVPKGRGLTKPLQSALQKLIETGVYRKIMALYGMEANGVSKVTINHASY